MNFLDFQYDGRYLSDYGFIVCEFDARNDVAIEKIGSQITFGKVSRSNGQRYTLTSAKYNDCITATFDICKDPEIYENNKLAITADEERDIIRWLNRRDFHWFRPYGGIDEKGYYCEYRASFNVETIKIRETIYGLRLTMETDAPYGYGKEEKIDMTFSASDSTSLTNKEIRFMSDEIGYIYPDVKITCKNGSGATESTPLIIRNSFIFAPRYSTTKTYRKGDHVTYDEETYICIRAITSPGRWNGDYWEQDDIEFISKTEFRKLDFDETIMLYGESQIIKSSSEGHDDIGNDFNYDFLRLECKLDSNINYISATLPCEMTITYRPIVKVSM